MTDNISELNKYIKILQDRYPYFSYINGLAAKCDEVALLVEKLAIIVKGIPKHKIPEFMKYAEDSILYPCFDRGISLPSIILLQQEEEITADLVFPQWNKIKTHSRNWTDVVLSKNDNDKDVGRTAWKKVSNKEITLNRNHSNSYSSKDLAMAA